MRRDEEKILTLVTYEDYQKGLYYDEDAIYAYESFIDRDGKHFEYSVHSQSSYIEYEVSIVLSQRQIKTSCDCPQFKRMHSCKHVAACLICYSNEIFKTKTTPHLKEKSKEFLRELKQNFRFQNKDVGIRKELNLVCELQFDFKEYSYWGRSHTILLKAKIGDKKMYSLNTKFADFIRAYRNEESFVFGKEFTYNPQVYFLSKETEEMLAFLEDTFDYGYRNLELEDRSFKRFVRLNHDLVNVDGISSPIKIQNGFFFQANLLKREDQYCLDFHCDFEQVFSLTSDDEYLWYEDKIYRLNLKERYLFALLQENNLSQLVFSEAEFQDFKTCFLPYIKNQLTVDASVPNLVLSKEPTVRYYFDLEDDFIEAKIIFDYDGYEVSYGKQKANDLILRDEELEQKSFEVLLPYGFELNKGKLLLEDLEDMAFFLEDGLDELSAQYSIYTSENLKQVHVVHQPKVTTTFHLGMNQILNYHLEMEGLTDQDLRGFFQSLQLKKKYYRLKNGSLVDLASNQVQELSRLQSELDLDLERDGKIPKYKALYLDSLKKGSSIITTNDSFDAFIKKFEAYKNCDISLTKEEQTILRDYQIEGVSWLYTIYQCGFGGILADEMGLGKSLQTIIFLKKVLQANDKALIVCPTSLVYNWENEFKKFGKGLDYVVLSGMKKNRLHLLETTQGSVYITSYGLLKEDFDVYKEMNFKCFILDEAQAIKNPSSLITKVVKQIPSEARFALTGTPIENSVLELWSIFDFIMPGFLANLTTFQQKYKIKETFDEETNQLLLGLKNQIKPFLLRRKKSDVAKDLPEKNENTIFIDLEPEQKKIYAAAVAEANDLMTKALMDGGFKKNKMIILSLLTKLRQICITPSIVVEDYQQTSSKLEELLKIVKEIVTNGHKILLFTSFRTALNIVKEKFDEAGITSYTIAGDVPSKKRASLVDAFNKDDTNVFLIMLKSGGTGLNLTSADVVIHLDLWWNPQAENQATDRTHRIGQTHAVDVIKLICKNTIEERILELQEQKKQLSDKLIEEGTDEAGFIRGLTEQDIRNLLRYENEGEN